MRFLRCPCRRRPPPCGAFDVICGSGGIQDGIRSAPTALPLPGGGDGVVFSLVAIGRCRPGLDRRPPPLARLPLLTTTTRAMPSR
jgi:hypothetical protein